MKLTAYEVRKDEEENLRKYAQRCGVAEYTVMMILMSLRKYKPALYRINVNDYSLDGLVGGELCEMTVGIIGTGKIVKEEVKKYAVYRDLDTIYKECDIISLHTPLMDSTYHMIDRDAVEKMKKGVRDLSP